MSSKFNARIRKLYIVATVRYFKLFSKNAQLLGNLRVLHRVVDCKVEKQGNRKCGTVSLLLLYSWLWGFRLRFESNKVEFQAAMELNSPNLDASSLP